jgi:DNA repair exonuclease SbcCD ATPase subunit
VEKTVEAVEWPSLYRERSEIQENSFKRMIDHGALNINYGRKKIVGPDRHQLREQDKVEQALKVSQQKVETKRERLSEQHQKVTESTDKGHSKRLEQRQQRLGVIEGELKKAQEKQNKLKEKLDALGTPKERADRDFRKQTIMTFRTLLLENSLLCFLMALWGKLAEKVSQESILSMLFERSGSRLETDSEVIYGVNSVGLSAPYKETLQKVVEALCAMNLTHQGKPIRVRVREAPG